MFLQVLDSQKTDDMFKLLNTPDHNDRVKLNDWALEAMEVDSELIEHHRLVCIHFMPFTTVNGTKKYFMYSAMKGNTLYRTLPITTNDFLAAIDGDPMELSTTLIGKISKVFNNPEIGIDVKPEHYNYPAVIGGNLVVTYEIAAEKNEDLLASANALGECKVMVEKADLDKNNVDALSRAIVEKLESTQE